jgi:hypothetical protein
MQRSATNQQKLRCGRQYAQSAYETADSRQKCSKTVRAYVDNLGTVEHGELVRERLERLLGHDGLEERHVGRAKQIHGCESMELAASVLPEGGQMVCTRRLRIRKCNDTPAGGAGRMRAKSTEHSEGSDDNAPRSMNRAAVPASKIVCNDSDGKSKRRRLRAAKKFEWQADH